MRNAAEETDNPGPAANLGPTRRFGRRTLIIIGVGLPILAFLAVLAWASFSSDGAPDSIAVNESIAEVQQKRRVAPNFNLQSLDGSALSLADLHGKVVMLDFWASWCQPCRDEAPVLAQIYGEYRERGVEFVGINLWDNTGDAELFLQQQGHEYPKGIDSEGKIAISYGVRGIPEKFFISRDGSIARKFTGPMNPALLRQILDALLTESS